MICKNCGKELIEGAKFCVGCGTPVEETPVVNENTQPVVDNYFEGAQMPAEPVASAEPVAPAEPAAPVYEAPVYQASQQPAAPVYGAPTQPQAPVYQAPVPPMNGAPQQQYIPPVNNPMNAPVNPDISEEEFFERFADKNVKSNYKASMIIAFITAAISIVPVALGNVVGILDIIIYVVVGVLMIKKKNWIFPLICAVWGGIGTVIGMATTGTPSGIVALIIAISATIGAKKVHDAYQSFKNTGVAPVELISAKKKK